jgi:hypothetical protein
MPAVYVTTAELRSNLGIGTLYSDATVEEVCQTAEDLLNQYLWFNTAPVVGTALQSNVATLMLANPNAFVTGQNIVVSGCGATFNGTHTITGTIPPSTGTTSLIPVFMYQYGQANYPNGYSFVQYARTSADQNFHKVVPYGVATGPDHKTQTYATTPAIREAAMIIAVDIWQARQVSQTGGVGMDGISASPYRMGYQLINRVRGLIQPYSSPASLVG